jgi:hypothetical protein
MGGKSGAVGGSSIGVIIALVLGALAYWVLALVTGELYRARTAQAAMVPAAPAS